MDDGRSLSVNFRMILARICVAIWIFLSVPVVVYRKYILDKKPPINPHTARVPIVIRNPLLQPPLPPPPPTSPTAAGYGGGCLSESVLMKIPSYISVPIWIFLTFTLIVYNKYILDNRFYNWPFPISLTLLHLSFCATLAAVFMKLFKLVEPVPAMSRNLYISSVVPVSALYSLSLCLSNSAFIYLSLSLIQILKLIIPVAVYAIGVLFRKDEFKIKATLNMLVICSGVAIASYWEAARFGIGLQLGGIAFEAARLVMIRILLTSKRVYLNPITSVYYIAPCSFAFLVVPWFFLEYPALIKNRSFHLEFLILGTNSLCPFALNLAAFLLAGKTSALTIYVAAVVKDWSLIGFSWLVIKDRMAPMNLVGYSVAFVGVAYYNYNKQQGLMMARQWHDELGRSLLEEGECQGNGRGIHPRGRRKATSSSKVLMVCVLLISLLVFAQSIETQQDSDCAFAEVQCKTKADCAAPCESLGFSGGAVICVIWQTRMRLT